MNLLLSHFLLHLQSFHIYYYRFQQTSQSTSSAATPSTSAAEGQSTSSAAPTPSTSSAPKIKGIARKTGGNKHGKVSFALPSSSSSASSASYSSSSDEDHGPPAEVNPSPASNPAMSSSDEKGSASETAPVRQTSAKKTSSEDEDMFAIGDPAGNFFMRTRKSRSNTPAIDPEGPTREPSQDPELTVLTAEKTSGEAVTVPNSPHEEETQVPVEKEKSKKPQVTVSL